MVLLPSTCDFFNARLMLFPSLKIAPSIPLVTPFIRFLHVTYFIKVSDVDEKLLKLLGNKSFVSRRILAIDDKSINHISSLANRD